MEFRSRDVKLTHDSMHCPSNVFIDTSILDQQAYNFASSAFTSFNAAAEGKGLTLLLPDPTEREMSKHISRNAHDALKALREAKRKAPFVSKWDQWPKEKNEWITEKNLQQIAIREFADFLAKFKVVRLNYEDVRMAEVMDWYHQAMPPFGLSKGKQKEFPDALALSALIGYAKRHKANIALISTDLDFRAACERYLELLYFPSLPAITESLLAPDKRIAEVKEVVSAEISKLTDRIQEDFTELFFYPEEEPEGHVGNIAVQEVEIGDFRVVFLGDLECSLAFDARVLYSAYVSYNDPDSLIQDSSEGFSEYLRKRKGYVEDFTEMSGIAKLRFDSSWQVIEAVTSLKFDDEEVCVVEIPPVESEPDW